VNRQAIATKVVGLESLTLEGEVCLPSGLQRIYPGGA